MKLNNYLLIYFCLFTFCISYGQTDRDVFNKIDSINKLALSHFHNNDLVKAFNHYNISSKLSDSIYDNLGSAVAKYNLGKIYTEMQDYEDAERSYLEMLESAKAINDNYLIANSYFSLAEMYRKDKSKDNVISYYKKALSFANKEDVRDENNIDRRNTVLFNIRVNLAEVYIERGQPKNAHIYLLRAKNNAGNSKPSSSFSKGLLSYVFGLYYIEKGLFNLANNEFLDAERQLKKCNAVDAAKCKLLLGKLYKKFSLSYAALNKKDEAYSMLINYNNTREQFFDAEKIKQKQVTESKLLLANYRETAEAATKEKLAQEKISNRIQLLNIGFIFIIVVLLILAKIFYNNYISKQKLSNILEIRNKQLEHSKNEAEKSSELKSKFISNVTHELRTPLYGVVGLTSLLLNSNDLSKKDSKYLKSLKYSGDYLLNLVNDILQIGKMESDKVELNNQSVELKMMVENIVNSFENRLQETNNKIQISIDDTIPRFITCDNVRLSQILINLIGNSVKFTENGKICLRIKKIDGNNDEVSLRFEVEDNGVGIDKAQHKTIFENFSQIHENTNVNYQGTGLGLAIVKNMVALFDGEIEMESELGKGSTFSFNVTFKVDNEAIKESLKKKNNKVVTLNSGYKILVAEDNKINQIVTKNLLQKENYECQIVKNGLEAVEALKEESFDLILMDINMPIMNGNEATKEIRKFNPTIPIIALTAADIEEVKKDYMAIGYNGIITKPFDTYEFFQMINTKIQERVLENVS
jgi:signal transduction histidine kinase/CheY-like chemotaxis protein